MESLDEHSTNTADTSNTYSNPQPQESHNTQRSPNLGTHSTITLKHTTIITRMICTQLHHKQMRTAKKDATDALPCLRGTRYACVRVEIANLFPHSTVLDPKGFRRKIGQSRSVCLSGFSYDTWYIHSINQCINDTSINVYTIHTLACFFNYLVFYNLIPN